MSIDWQNSRVLVTGGTGFVGRHLVKLLQKECRHVVAAGSKIDLAKSSWAENLGAFFTEGCFDYIFHLAGYNGGIDFNAGNPADIFARNTMMALNILEAAKQWKVKKFLGVVASCAYPSELPFANENTLEYATLGIMEETDFFLGNPHESVACHAYAKRNLQLATQYYHDQYGLNAVCACPTTLYGPGDSFDSEKTKVVGAMVRRFVDAVDNNEQTVTIWGSGLPLRELLYVEDAAKLLVQAMEHYEDSSLPLNFGSGQEISVMDLALLVAGKVGFNGKIVCDLSKPDGQHRKLLSLAKMKATLPGVGLTTLDVGIERTIADYRNRRSNAS